MEAETGRFKNFLAENEFKFTPERKAILQAVLATHHHFDADELVEILKRNGERISRATVYRTLDLLVKADMVQALDLGESRLLYEHTIGHKHHDHLICTGCGKAIEFDDGMIEKLQEKVCEDLNFCAHGHSLRIFGLCESCQ